MNEPFDRGTVDPEKELIQMWQEMPFPAEADPQQLTCQTVSEIRKIDRRIFWRNLREYLAGGVLIAFFVYRLFEPGKWVIAVAGIAAVGFVMTYLWRSHRDNKPLDPSAEPRAFQSALIARYDRQIRLLSRVKYWYVLPLYAWIFFVIVPLFLKAPASGIVLFAIATVFMIFIVWLNESYGVRTLRAERRKAEALIQEATQQPSAEGRGVPPNH
jgi:hypothetical protein